MSNNYDSLDEALNTESSIVETTSEKAEILKPKDTVVFMGAGSISSWCNDYAKQFKLEDLNVK